MVVFYILIQGKIDWRKKTHLNFFYRIVLALIVEYKLNYLPVSQFKRKGFLTSYRLGWLVSDHLSILFDRSRMCASAFITKVPFSLCFLASCAPALIIIKHFDANVRCVLQKKNVFLFDCFVGAVQWSGFFLRFLRFIFFLLIFRNMWVCRSVLVLIYFHSNPITLEFLHLHFFLKKMNLYLVVESVRWFSIHCLTKAKVFFRSWTTQITVDSMQSTVINVRIILP